MKDTWNKISNLGLEGRDPLSGETKRLKFFNQILFVGFFATLFHIGFVWPFIGSKALVFVAVNCVLLASLILNAKGKFTISKWTYLVALYSVGLITTLLLGGSTLFHIQVVLIFLSCLIIFEVSRKKERIQILLGIPIVVLIILIGELDWLEVPDFTNHYWYQVARLANISNLLIVLTIFVLFILKQNHKNEEDLSKAIVDLEKGNEHLEEIVHKRTEELELQKEQLERKNAEKELLLHEVHHRVRNNLQIIVSLINLQLRKKTSKEAAVALEEIRGRVESMSIVHQRMYQTSNFKSVYISDYLAHLLENMCKMYKDKKCTYNLIIKDDFKIKMESSVPLGLIINEIVANFFKHAYQHSESTFSISIEASNKGYIIRYADNGKGIQTKNENEESLGSTLISSLIEQLDGELKMFNNAGLNYTFQFPMLSIQDQSEESY